MQMHLTIAVFFAFTVVMAFIEDYLKESYKTIALAAYAVFMVLLASTKSIDGTADALIYEHIFYHNDEMLVVLTTEPTYLLLSRLVLALGGALWVIFLIYALITIPLKLHVLRKMTPFIFTALVIYVPVYFELHDLVQIRAAAAAAFLLLSFHPLCDKHYGKAFLLMLTAILFHYSAVVFLPFLFIGNRALSTRGRIIVACVIPTLFVCYLMGKDMFSLIPSSIMGGKLDFYQKTTEKGEWAMALLYKNVYFMLKCAMLYLCLYYYDLIVKECRMAPLLINLFIASVLSLMLFSTIPVIATRVSDLFGIIDCLVFTFTLYFVTPRYAARIGIAVVGLYMLIYNMLVAEYFA
jgi:hypothetical protein